MFARLARGRLTGIMRGNVLVWGTGVWREGGHQLRDAARVPADRQQMERAPA